MADEQALQRLIDRLLAEVCPQWEPPPRLAPAGVTAEQWEWERLEATRLRLGRALAERPDLAAERAGTILAAIGLDRGHTNQLVHPLIAAIGRRAVLEHLTEMAGDEERSWEGRGNAASAGYWVRSWQPAYQADLLREAYEAGAESAGEIQEYVRRHEPPRGPGDEVADLWPRFWLTCLGAFVTCQDAQLRQSLQTTFPLERTCYPPGSADLVDEARRIALEDADAFARLLNGSTGYGWAI
ncbi:hypothetical protein ACQP1W_21665 [Spirillospora sp. CA-255316]